MNPVLVLIDLQDDFLSTADLSPARADVVETGADLLSLFRGHALPVIHVVTTTDPVADNRMPHWKRADLWRCIAGTAGHETPERLRPVDGETVIHKQHFSAFSTPVMSQRVRELGCDTLIVAGVHTHGCVRQTVLDAYLHGLVSFIVEDAVGGYDPLHARISLDYLDGRAATVVSIADVRSMLSGNAPFAPDRRLDAEQGGRRRTTRSPDKGAPQVGDASVHAIREAVQKAASAQREWSRTSHGERAALLGRLAVRLEDDARDLAALIVREVSKPVTMARQEVDATIRMVDAVLRRFSRVGDPRDAEYRVRRTPVGVVAVVTPWNNPVYIPVGKILPALLFGNATVWKPSPRSSRVTRRVMEHVEALELPTSLLSCVTGGSRTAAGLMRCDAVDAVALTGGSDAGWSAQVACAARRVPLQAELGGNNASIVWPDGDLTLAAARIAAGAFGYAGQRCTANRRVVVHESISDDFTAMAHEATAALSWGDPLREDTVIGPVISREKKQAVERLLSRATGSGLDVTRVREGWTGEQSPAEDSAYCAPAIVRCSDPGHEIVQEETFGPVLVIQEASDEKTALDLCNGVRHGLVASLFSSSPDFVEKFKREARAGILKINSDTAGADIDVAFGGWKQSGIGPPEHGASDQDFYTRLQTVYE